MLDHAGQAPIASIQELRVEFQTKDGPVVGVDDTQQRSTDLGGVVHRGDAVTDVAEEGQGAFQIGE